MSGASFPRPDISDLIETCASLTDCERLWRAGLKFMRARGVKMLSYRHFDPAKAWAGSVTIRSDGFPDAWHREYIAERYHLVDPMPKLAAEQVHPVRWSEVWHNPGLDARERAFLTARARAVPGDGLAVHVFGPQMRNGYFSLGMAGDYDAPGPSAGDVLVLQAAAQVLHLRHCDLVAVTSACAPDLSPREKEVLEWMARGKSNVAISKILGLSRHTVDTLARRLFEKLDVNDRTTAAIRGLGSGLLQYHRMP